MDKHSILEEAFSMVNKGLLGKLSQDSRNIVGDNELTRMINSLKEIIWR